MGVFLAEIGPIGFEHVEEFGHYRGNAAKMARPLPAFQTSRNVIDVDPSLETTRINRFRPRRPDDVYSQRLEKPQITRQVAWITAQILIRAKLRRIDKNGHACVVAFRPGSAHEREVAFMKSPIVGTSQKCRAWKRAAVSGRQCS